MPAEGRAASPGGNIRPFRPEDAWEIAAMAATAAGAAEWTAESYEKLSRSNESVSFVSESDGHITGFIVGRRLGDEAEVLNLAVRPERRKGGIAAGLLQTFLRELGREGVARVYLEVRESNSPARDFYQKHGFTISGVRPKYYRDPDEAAMLMERKLKG